MTYLDNSATTPVRAEVAEAMRPYLDVSWGNPSSIHDFGRQANEALCKARRQVAALVNAQPEEIYFAPCATYANNVAILGRARFAQANGQGKHLIVSAIEHPSVLGPAQFLESNGWQVSYLPVDKYGFVSPGHLEAAITEGTSIISIMWANNEIGTVEPIDELASIASSKGIYFHTDAVQVPGKLEIDVKKLDCSTLSLSGHKFYAPKGIGALYVKNGVNLMPIVFGGGQEKGIFPGTESLSNIVALGKAAEIAQMELAESVVKLRNFQALIFEALSKIEGIKITGPVDIEHRVPGHVSIAVSGAEGEAIVLRLDLKGICVSSGSACHMGIMEPSTVLKAIGLKAEDAAGSIRISCGSYHQACEIEDAVKSISDVLANCVAKNKVKQGHIA